ncbi:hypothetical protein JOB18_009244 [Solea senegalensis]|uniref:Uncharacterized protein n=2 Tax=Solea senegalensis TaxID=28829 RepID=A0AAV6QV67_SOLSE|nr:stabilizer of axonemal microtubules 2 [Solea senegalensis]KAG7495957.1 hypothetical protein JOB18_009244 [Solea senegalensis]
MRKCSSSQRAQTRASMTTEYQERFLPPCCIKTVISTPTQRDLCHPLRSGAGMTMIRKTKDHQRCSSAPHNPASYALNQLASKMEDYTSVYKNDFQAWKTNQSLPYRLHESLKVNQGLAVTGDSKDRSHDSFVQVYTNSKPFESITSYRSDYVAHSLQPRTRREKPANQTSKDLLSESTASFRPNLVWQTNPKLFDRASELYQQFKNCSLENKHHCQDKFQVSRPPADHDAYLSTTHAVYVPHKCERTRPILPSVLHSKKSKEPFLATTTMKEDYRAWNVPQRLLARETWNGPGKPTLQCAHLQTSNKAFVPPSKTE